MFFEKTTHLMEALGTMRYPIENPMKHLVEKAQASYRKCTLGTSQISYMDQMR